jgi:simple sugar transport system ATP-binding protein
MAAMEQQQQPTIELVDVSKSFAGTDALRDVSMQVYPGEVHCLLGDNGAGKSTLIKVLSGVHEPSRGSVRVDGAEARFTGPRDARALGIATVHQDVGIAPLMSVGRNFFLAAEPMKGRGPLRRLDIARANRVAIEELQKMGITRVTDGNQFAGTMSGGERQALGIARAIHFGARVLILDEPTSALGVKEAETVLRLMLRARAAGVALVFITHNAHHALMVGDRFTVLIHGAVAASFRRGERTREETLDLMAGGERFEALELELEQDGAWTGA